MIERRLTGEVGEIGSIIGKKVKLLRSQGWRGAIKSCEKSYTISDVYFRISLDGKVICCVLVEGLPDNIFTLSDIAII